MMSPETTAHNTTPLLGAAAWGAKGLVQHLFAELAASMIHSVKCFFATTEVRVERMYMKQPVSCGQFIVILCATQYNVSFVKVGRVTWPGAVERLVVAVD